MIKKQDHHYPLAPDFTLDVYIDSTGRITPVEPIDLPATNGYCWLLAIEYKAKSRWAIPAIKIKNSESLYLFTQYFEAGQSGKRMLNLSGVTSFENICLVTTHCKLATQATLLGFNTPPLNDGGPILIVAPHPDDAELAAYGFYRQHNDQVWILTLTAGENQKRLERQYLPHLDNQLAAASRRKGWIRTWNSTTTPLLAGIPLERNIMLGYFNDTLPALLENLKAILPSRVDATLKPCAFRLWNQITLATDPEPNNSGQDLLRDVIGLLDHIKPHTLVITHPEIDPHPDHIAAAQVCAMAIREAKYRPEQVLMYANHLAGTRGFPRGPAHAAAGLWPLNQNKSRLGQWRIYSKYLDLELQKEKAFALDTMHDLRVPLRLEKRLKRWLHRRLSGIPRSEWRDYGAHDYFQTHIKAHEVFAVVPVSAFLAGMQVDSIEQRLSSSESEHI